MSNSADDSRSAKPGNSEAVAPVPASADSSHTPTTAGGAAKSGDGGRPLHAGILLLVMLLAATVSTVSSWQLIERFHKTFQLPASVTSGLGSTLSPAQAAAVAKEVPARDIKNLSLTLAIFGAVTGLCFGIATGLARRSQPAIVAGILGGFLCGAVAGALGGAAEYGLGTGLKPLTMLSAEHRVILGHLTGWAIAGLGVGLGAGCSSRSRQTFGRFMVAAFAGGLVGGALFVPLISVFVPEVDTEQLIPVGTSAMLIWVALPTILMGLGMWRILAVRKVANAEVVGQG